eukprot:TRINITY_DN10757_c0_g1_i5.p1 TRINITY_DN10757_c0_g1~~TRINITY_DN10757_c0_g1_i5.p1  ORF type:complete len:138 (-),score=2.01 TRINITY_DN10757_c0_g1_i5:45-458(-)
MVRIWPSSWCRMSAYHSTRKQQAGKQGWCVLTNQGSLLSIAGIQSLLKQCHVEDAYPTEISARVELLTDAHKSRLLGENSRCQALILLLCLGPSFTEAFQLDKGLGAQAVVASGSSSQSQDGIRLLRNKDVSVKPTS